MRPLTTKNILNKNYTFWVFIVARIKKKLVKIIRFEICVTRSIVGWTKKYFKKPPTLRKGFLDLLLFTSRKFKIFWNFYSEPEDCKLKDQISAIFN